MRGQIVPASRSRSGGLPLGRLTLLALVIGTRLAADEGASPVDIDEVMCALCHFEQGDEFVESIHYQKGLLLCDDCHGGDPFAAEIEKAKAPETGFIGKPRREKLAAICGRCHTGPTRQPHLHHLSPQSPRARRHPRSNGGIVRPLPRC